MPSINLTAAKMKFLKPEPGKQVDYFDKKLPGFFVRVSPRGRKTFGVLYRQGGRLRRMTLGTSPPLTLAGARKDATSVLRDAAHGLDPAADKILDRRADSFEQTAADYLEQYAKPKKKSWKGDEWMIKKYIIPEFGTVHAKEIARRDVRTMLDRIARSTPIMANRVRALLNKIFNWAILNELIETNPVYLVPMPCKERKRQRVLSEDEIKRLWTALNMVPKGDKAHRKYRSLTACILKLQLLTAQRSKEVRGMEWTELELDKGWWTIPGEKTKNGLAHRVPLTSQAIRVIEEAKRLCETKLSQYVFPGPRGGHIANVQNAIRRKRTQLGIEFRGHDLRRTAASMMTGMGIPRLTVSKILNHVEPGVTAVYDRHSYDKEKRDALETWAKCLVIIVSGLQLAQTSES
jgi:integrase